MNKPLPILPLRLWRCHLPLQAASVESWLSSKVCLTSSSNTDVLGSFFGTVTLKTCTETHRGPHPLCAVPPPAPSSPHYLLYVLAALLPPSLLPPRPTHPPYPPSVFPPLSSP